MTKQSQEKNSTTNREGRNKSEITLKNQCNSRDPN